MLRSETSSRGLDAVGDAFKQLRKDLGELSLNLTVWDHLGEPAESFQPCNEFCRLLQEAGVGCREEAGRLAARILQDGQAGQLATACGGCAVGVPVYRRRRLIGAAVACFATTEMLEEEPLARLCQRLRLDLTHMRGLAEQVEGHTRREADHWGKMLQWLLDRDMAVARNDGEIALLSTNLSSTYEELSLLYRISGAMLVTEGLGEFLQRICEEMLEVMQVESTAAIAYAVSPPRQRDALVQAGKRLMSEADLRRLIETRVAPAFTKDNRILVDNEFAASPEVPGQQAVRGLIGVPLLDDGAPVGAILAMNKRSGDFNSIDLKLLDSIAGQVSIFLVNRRLYDDLQDLLMGVLHALTASIDAKDPYTCGHSQRVAFFSRRLAEAMGFPPERVERIYLAGLLHDVGKIGVSEQALHKQGRLTDEEYAQMKCHPDLGARILGGIRQLQDVVVGIRSHHERIDGKGYPESLRGEQISIAGRILGLADALDAMTSDRTYRKALDLAHVVEEIRNNAGTQFDADLVEILLGWDLESLLGEARQAARSVLAGSPALEVAP